MNRRVFLAAAASIPGAALSVSAWAQPPAPADPEIPPENDWRGERPARPGIGDAAERAERLFEAVLRDDPEHARDFFFPRDVFRIVKGIADPDRYWSVLWSHYERDIHALHAHVPAEATFERFEMTRRGGWVERREEANAVPYWASRHDWVHYRVGEHARRFEIRTLINWGPRWFVTHLG